MIEFNTAAEVLTAAAAITTWQERTAVHHAAKRFHGAEMRMSGSECAKLAKLLGTTALPSRVRAEAREAGKSKANALKVQRRTEARWDAWMAR